MFKKLVIGALSLGLVAGIGGGYASAAEVNQNNSSSLSIQEAKREYKDITNVQRMYAPGETIESSIYYDDGTYAGILEEYDREDHFLGTIVYYEGSVYKK